MEEKDIVKTHSGRITFGIIFIVIGVVFLLANLDIDILGEWRRAVISWQMLCIIVGLAQLSKSKFMEGFLFLGIGVFFDLPRIPVIDLPQNFMETWWPLIVIYSGVIMLMFHTSRIKIKSEEETSKHNCCDKSCDIHEAQTGGKGTVNYNEFMSGQKLHFNEPIFRGGNLRVVMGGIELDLRDTFLQDGETHLYCNSMLGGIVLYVPETWTVELESHAFIGGFDDKRKTVPATSDKRLILHINAFMGGGELKNS